MNQKGFASVFAVLVIGVVLVLVGGYYLNNKKKVEPTKETTVSSLTPTATRYPEELKLNSKSDLSQTNNWKTYRNEESHFELKYPSSWRLVSGGQVLEYGDLISFMENERNIEGEAASITIGKPFEIESDLKTWVNEYFDSTSAAGAEFSEDDVNGVHYEKVFVCGLGCYTYFVTQNRSEVFIILTNKGMYFPEKNDQILINILHTFKFTN